MATLWRSEEEREEYLKNQSEQEVKKPRYIDANLLLEELEDSRPINWTGSEVETQAQFDFDVFKHIIGYQPTADVAEVKHGEWIQLDECANEGIYCSVCHKKVYKIEYANQALKSKYCPNCGAKMDGGISNV